MLLHILDRLQAAGFREAFIVIGYLGEMIREALKDYPMKIEFGWQQPVDGTAHAALLAKDFAGEDAFLLTYGDILVDPSDYRAMCELYGSAEDVDGVIAVKWAEDPWQGAAVYEEGGRVVRIIEKPPKGTSTTHWNSAGIYIFNPSIFPALEKVELSPRGEYELTSAIQTLIEEGRRLLVYEVRGSWRDVGRPEDLGVAEKLVQGEGKEEGGEPEPKGS